MSAGPRTAVFAYGSLVSRASAALTLGAAGAIHPAELRGWRRGFTQARHNPTCEKTFARADNREVPEWILSLAVDPEHGASVNGGLIELTEEQAVRLDARELRYERADVTAAVVLAASSPAFDRAFTYTPRPENRAPESPPGAVILSSYVEATESAFAELGPGELERYRESTWIPDVEVIEGTLVRDEIPPGNPRRW